MTSGKPTYDELCKECGKKSRSRGFCVACYYRKLRHGEFESGSQTPKFIHRLSNIDTKTKTADCLKCGHVKIRQRSKGSWRCAVQANEKSRLYKQAYRAAQRQQLNETCEICGSSDDLCWDHDHRTGEFRGTLCGACNKGIGLLREDRNIMKSAIIYLFGQA